MPSSRNSRFYTYIKPVVENKTVRSTLPYIFSIITITILLVFALRPTASTIAVLQKELENNQTVLASLQEKSRNLDAARQNYNNIDPVLKNKIATALPNQANVSSVVTSLQTSLTSNASVSAIQIQPLTLVDPKASLAFPPQVKEIDFSFNAQGSYDQLMIILENVNSSARLITISSITMSKQTDKPTVLSITGKAYFLR